jgi:flavin reductase (DIM6/NTAB) family NADH-FMN oxidoreductase RutF
MSSGETGTPVTSREFRHACARFATGITIATVLDAQGLPHGLTVNSFSSVSLDPPLISICLGHAITMIDAFRESKYFGINVLSDSQQHLSDRFASKGQDRFDGLEWYRAAHGTPFLPGALAAIECAQHKRVTAGDHDIFIGEMLETRLAEGEPLIYFASRYRTLA